ncbi:unnamed protein product [Lactuca saligna]|uniref:Knottins-like domain-containing protein n=1 Tax=Lactuca saligna TaxID=75948 RepID=A0AA35XYI0_LACSI|nr:unnamed protein product [Lactuca saligna]
MAKISLVISVFLVVIFVVAISEMATADEPQICEKASMMFSGICISTSCDRKCKEWEKALHGACHLREVRYSCYCYYDCKKVPPPKPGSPPAVVVSPPPPGGGGSPPSPDAGGSPPSPDAGGSTPAC